jgi:hypothetical protein
MLVAAGLAIVVTIGSARAGEAAPLPSGEDRHQRAAIDDLAPYQPQRRCDPRAKPGVVAFRSRVLRAYPSTSDYGIGRSCSTNGISEHKEGRAWDWGVKDKTVAKKFLKSLLARDRGKKYADARRFGIMYIIYDNRIWRSYGDKRGWEDYDCSGVTRCHEDHVHFSFSWEGAERRTSAWDGTPVRYRTH